MKSFIITYFLISCGAIIQGVAMALFLFPHSIPSGGAGGLAVLLNYWFQIPLGFALWIVNFSLLVVAIRWLGNSSAIGTMYGISVTSFTIHLVNVHVYVSFSNVWIDLIVGSLLLGTGVGILLKQDVSNGGMGVIALIVSKYKNIAPGKPLLLLNGSIFLFTGLIIAWQLVIQAILSQWLATRVVDFMFRFKFDWINQHNLALRRKK